MNKIEEPNLITAVPLPSRIFHLFDETKLRKKYQIDQRLIGLQYLPLSQLRKVLIQYRFFTHHYISDLSLLVAKLPFGPLRSLLAEFLDEELGEGDAGASHPELYDQFLRSIGCTEEQIEIKNERVCEPLLKISEQVAKGSWQEGVGLRGLGGECLCQVYLETAYSYLQKNPALKALDFDSTFWAIHSGKVDQEHRRLTLRAIAQLIDNEPEIELVLEASYRVANEAWDQFWDGSFAEGQM